MVFTEPLALYDLLVNTFSGSIEIFMFFSLIVISFASARFKMPNIIFGVSIAIFSILMSQYLGGVYLLAMVLTSFVVFATTSRVFR